MTNLHNVTGRHPQTGQPLSATGGIPDHITIMHNVLNRLGTWVPVQEALSNGPTKRWIEHPILAERGDFVALPLENLQNVHLYPYDVANPGPEVVVGPAATVSVVGFPFGMTAGGLLPVWATGFVASEPDIDFNELPTFLIDCRSRPGQSGSPVIAYRSGAVAMADGSTAVGGTVFRLLGIYSGRINDQSDIGIVWKVKALQELIASI